MWDCEAFTEMLVAYLPQSEGIPVSYHHHHHHRHHNLHHHVEVDDDDDVDGSGK